MDSDFFWTFEIQEAQNVQVGAMCLHLYDNQYAYIYIYVCVYIYIYINVSVYVCLYVRMTHKCVKWFTKISYHEKIVIQLLS